jgi:aminoglycoside phosphotransferase (APT) family kinase protein
VFIAGITLAQRDLAQTRERLEAWFRHRFGEATVSELRVANRAVGRSSESLMFDAEVAGHTSEYVVRIPPAGGGIFRDYDIGAQALTQELLHEYGVATPSPLMSESDRAWLGAKFLVMPRIVGHTPSDTSYATRGWLHDAGPGVQRRARDSFLKTRSAGSSVASRSIRARRRCAGAMRGCPMRSSTTQDSSSSGCPASTAAPT